MHMYVYTYACPPIKIGKGKKGDTKRGKSQMSKMSKLSKRII